MKFLQNLAIWNLFCRIWNFLDQLWMSPKAGYTIYVPPEDAEYSIYHDNDDLIEENEMKRDPEATRFIESLVKVKDNLESSTPTPEIIKAIDYCINIAIPKSYNKSLLEDNKEILISAYDLKEGGRDDKELWFRTKPFLLKKFANIGMPIARDSGSIIVIDSSDLDKLVNSYKEENANYSEPVVNSVGIYR